MESGSILDGALMLDELNIRGRSYRMKERKALATASGAPAPTASE